MTRLMTTCHYGAPLLTLLGALAATTSWGQTRTIIVEGTGQATCMPDRVEISGTISGSAKMAEDALTKYQGNKRRLETAVQELKLAHLTLTPGGPAIQTSSIQNPQVVVNGNQNQPQVDPTIVVRETMTFEIADVADPKQLFETVLKVIDMAKDNGVALSTESNPALAMMFGNRFTTESSLATFRVTNPDELRKQAYASALKDATARAEHIAQLSSMKLGPLISVEETKSGSRGKDVSQDSTSVIAAVYGIKDNKSPKPAFSSETYGEITADVVLRVTFELVK